MVEGIVQASSVGPVFVVVCKVLKPIRTVTKSRGGFMAGRRYIEQLESFSITKNDVISIAQPKLANALQMSSV